MVGVRGMHVSDIGTGLFACPACDCLFVGAAGANGTARCPLCHTTTPRSGREWLEARRVPQALRAQPDALRLLEPAAPPSAVPASVDAVAGSDAFEA